MGKLLETSHRIIMSDARRMKNVADQSIDLVVTSPPYPMVQMWDDLFCACDPAIANAVEYCDPNLAFKQMHRHLDKVWDEVVRVLKPGGIACINIGDATRSFNDHFQLFANHAEIISRLTAKGMSQLPTILWRKITNAPTKFMGSGMLPPGAYVTLEHEYILIFRLGGRREFLRSAQKRLRYQSAIFWEERNTWFSDIWMDLYGVTQTIDKGDGRQRSAAFPIELPYRLICMFSLKGESVLDPFLGTGSTMVAAMCAARKSVGYELEKGLQKVILERAAAAPELAAQIIDQRLEAHKSFVIERTRAKGPLKYRNRMYGFPVMSRQEEELYLQPVRQLQHISNGHIKLNHGQDYGEPTAHA